jgi:hypothetical protein
MGRDRRERCDVRSYGAYRPATSLLTIISRSLKGRRIYRIEHPQELSSTDQTEFWRWRGARRFRGGRLQTRKKCSAAAQSGWVRTAAATSRRLTQLPHCLSHLAERGSQVKLAFAQLPKLKPLDPNPARRPVNPGRMSASSQCSDLDYRLLSSCHYLTQRVC